MQVNSSTQTFNFHWHSSHRLTRPHRRFLTHTRLTFVRENIWRPLTILAHIGLTPVWILFKFPAYSGFTPVHKDIWELFNFPVYAGLIPARMEIWRLSDFPAHSGLTPVRKAICRLVVFQNIPKLSMYERLLLPTGPMKIVLLHNVISI